MLLIGFLLLVVLGVVFKDERQPAVTRDKPVGIAVAPVIVPTPESKESIKIGDIGYLEWGKSQYIWLAVRDSDWNDFLDAENFAAKGGEGATGPLARLVNAGRAFCCSSGTRIRVEKASFSSMFVRVLDGEFAQSTGWVQREAVHKEPSSLPKVSNVLVEPSSAFKSPDIAPKKESKVASKSTNNEIKDNVIIDRPGPAGHAFLSSSIDNARALKRVIETKMIGDFSAMADRGDFVIVLNGTEAKLLEKQSDASKVRLTDHQGAIRIGWVLAEHFHSK